MRLRVRKVTDYGQWVAGQLISTGVLRGLLGRTDQWAWRIPYAIQWIWPVPIIIGVIFAPEVSTLHLQSHFLAAFRATRNDYTPNHFSYNSKVSKIHYFLDQGLDTNKIRSLLGGWSAKGASKKPREPSKASRQKPTQRTVLMTLLP
jgi:hypothetical protein